MRNTSIIKSLLDTDLYKLTTSYAYMIKYPQASGTFTFVDRNKTVVSDEEYNEIHRQIYNFFPYIHLTDEEMEWCKEHIPFIPAFYWEWLRSFNFDYNKIKINRDEAGHLGIEVNDLLYKVTLYEVPILAIVSEVLCEKTAKGKLSFQNAQDKLVNKINISRKNGFKFSEFGTRRRFSYDVQNWVCNTLRAMGSDVCVGTSNVHFAMKYNMKAMGTHPHEWFMFHGAQFGYKHANYMALEAWQNIYQGDLGIALTDTYTSDVFFRNFSKVHAKLFDGIRHDSGDPYVFTDKAIERYKEHGIDPSTKTIVFSDGLDFEKAADIHKYCQEKGIRSSFGIGTNLTNDVDGKPCNIVMKLTNCRMNDNQPLYPTIKLSDVPGKHLGSLSEIDVAKFELRIR